MKRVFSKKGNSRFCFVSESNVLSKSKRSQVTVFVVIGILLVGSVVGFMIFKNSGNDLGLGNRVGLDDIESSILDCGEEVSRNALETIAIQGGYYNEPAEYFDLEWAFFPYYYSEGKYLIPSLKDIENELEDYVNDNMDFCLEVLDFENHELNYANPKTIVSIKDSGVEFKIDLDVEIVKGDETTSFELKDYPIVHDSKLKDIYYIADYYTDSHQQDPALYCISCIAELAQERDLYVDIIDFSESDELIVISDNRTNVEPYSFAFLNKYTGDEVSPNTLTGDEDAMPPAPELGDG